MGRTSKAKSKFLLMATRGHHYKHIRKRKRKRKLETSKSNGLITTTLRKPKY